MDSMVVGAGFCMYKCDVVVKSSRSLYHLLMSSCTLCNVNHKKNWFPFCFVIFAVLSLLSKIESAEWWRSVKLAIFDFVRIVDFF